MSTNYLSLVFIYCLLEPLIDNLVLQFKPYCKRSKRNCFKRPWLLDGTIIEPNLAGLSYEIESLNLRNYEILLIEQANVLRSSLVFYYTQIYPELIRLYQVVANLLECAQLIEEIAQVHPKGPQLGETHSQHAICDRKLSRYSLVIMLAAYLNSRTARQITSNSRKDQLLARHLIEFLKGYSEKGVLCVQPTLRYLGEVELVSIAKSEANISNVDDKVLVDDEKLLSKANELIVYDPVSANTNNGPERLLVALKKSAELNELTNLTSGIKSLPEIRILFAKLTAYLSKLTESKKVGTPTKASGRFSILVEMLELTSCESQVQAYLKNEYRREIDTQVKLSRTSSLERGPNRCSWRNLIYLSIFFIAGNALLNFTDFLQDDIREDLIMLKKASMLSEDENDRSHLSEYSQKGTEDATDDDGSSFLTSMFDTIVQVDELDLAESLLLKKFVQLRMNFDDEGYEDDELEQQNEEYASHIGTTES